MNVELLERVKQHILEEPRRLDMDAIRTPLRAIADNLRPACGTVACIAGWTIKLRYPKAQEFGNFFRVNAQILDCNDAESLLEIDGHNGYRLFLLDSWPKEFAKKYRRARTAQGRAKIAAARIEHFIATEGEE